MATGIDWVSSSVVLGVHTPAARSLTSNSAGRHIDLVRNIIMHVAAPARAHWAVGVNEWSAVSIEKFLRSTIRSTHGKRSSPRAFHPEK